MKIKILFVDDEIPVLQGLRRMLAPMRQEWDMEFVGSGVEALAQMAQTSFDILVSDVNMPEMTGHALLEETMKRYPKTIRFALSDYSEMDEISKNPGATHQFLVKPCDLGSLKAAVRNACKRETSSRTEKLKQLLAKIHRVPSIPSLYVELVQLMQDPEAEITEIGAIIAKDMAMTAIILKLVNSAYFGLRHQVSNTTEATIYLGVETIRSLVLSVNAFSQFQPAKIEGFSLDALWLHSLETAAAARTIACLEGVDEKTSTEAFVGGMLHDIGKLVLAANFTKQYREVVQLTKSEGKQYFEAEQEIFGVNHSDVGGRILSLWGLPIPVVEATASHHEPSLAGHSLFTPLTAVHVADVIVNQRGGGQSSPTIPLDTDYLSELGLVGRFKVWSRRLAQD